MVSEQILLKYGAQTRRYEKGEPIFAEGSRASYYFQIQNGRVKMASMNEDGKEAIQKIFHAGESFGEPSLLGDFRFPASAEALCKSSILALHKSDFERLLRENPDLVSSFFKLLVTRLQYKAKVFNLISQCKAKERIYRFLQVLAAENLSTQGREHYEVKMSRQHIADSLGLRVETTIRAVKELQLAGVLEIRRRKIFLRLNVDRRA